MMWGHAAGGDSRAKRARNADDARALWEKSEELTGTTFAV